MTLSRLWNRIEGKENLNVTFLSHLIKIVKPMDLVFCILFQPVVPAKEAMCLA